MKLSLLRALPAAAVAALLATPALAAPKTVKVDCTKGKSVQAALASNGDPLTIEITGICVENVVVRRDNVTFLGSDPALDGIRAASATEEFSAAVLVRESRNIHFQNLQFAGGNTSGLRVENARRNISADNCLFHDNGTWGAIAVGGTIEITNSTARDNRTGGSTGGGLTAAESGQLYCSSCILEDNPDPTGGFGVIARTGGIVGLEDTTIDGVRFGAAAIQGGQVTIVNSDVTGDFSSLFASDHATLQVDGSSVAGLIFLDTKGRMELFDVVQTSTGLPNFAEGDSFLQIFAGAAGSTSFADDWILDGFTKGESFGPVAFDGLVCSVNSDFDCDGTESKTSSSCGLCP